MPRRVTCARRHSERPEPHLRLTHIGGEGWMLSAAEAIAILAADLNASYLETEAGTEYLVVRLDRRHEYLTTEVDGPVPDSLLALPECP